MLGATFLLQWSRLILLYDRDEYHITNGLKQDPFESARLCFKYDLLNYYLNVDEYLENYQSTIFSSNDSS
jgi:hypothetical protein